MPGPPASALPGGREEGGLRPGSGLGFAAFPIAARWRVSALHSRLAARPLRSAAAQWGGGALEPPEFLPQLLRWASHSPRGPLGGRPQVSPALTPSLHDGHGVLSSPTDRTSAAASHLSGQGQGEGRGSRRPREPPPICRRPHAEPQCGCISTPSGVFPSSVLPGLVLRRLPGLRALGWEDHCAPPALLASPNPGSDSPPPPSCLPLPGYLSGEYGVGAPNTFSAPPAPFLQTQAHPRLGGVTSALPEGVGLQGFPVAPPGLPHVVGLLPPSPQPSWPLALTHPYSPKLPFLWLSLGERQGGRFYPLSLLGRSLDSRVLSRPPILVPSQP